MKNLSIFTLLCLLLTFQFSPAQSPDTLWTKAYGGFGWDEGNCVQQTTDGGYIILGETSSFGAGNSDIWLLKTDHDGDSLWTKTFGNTAYDRGRSVQQTTDGGYIIVGSALQTGTTNIWLLKTDCHGDTLWTRIFGGSQISSGYSVQQTNDDGYIIVGSTSPLGTYGNKIWLLKTDSNGDTLWTKTFGGSSNVEGRSVQQTIDGGYIIAGYDVLPVSTNIWLIKTDANGDTLWTKIYESGWPGSVQQTTDGGYVIVGMKMFTGGNGYIWLLKTDSNGDTLWTKTFGESFTNAGNSVRQTRDGGYIIAGGTYDFYLPFLFFQIIRTDSAGNSLWTKTFADGYGNCVQETTDGGYIFTGYFVHDHIGDLWLIKTEPDPVHITTRKTELFSSYQLFQNYPNPFNPSTTIEFYLPQTSEVTLKIFNILGEEVATLVSASLHSGSYKYTWDASNFASGLYLYELRAGKYTKRSKMVLMR